MMAEQGFRSPRNRGDTNVCPSNYSQTLISFHKGSVSREYDNAQKYKTYRSRPDLLTEFLKPLGLNQNKWVRELDIPAARVNFIIRGTRRITPDMALRLGVFSKPDRNCG